MGKYPEIIIVGLGEKPRPRDVTRASSRIDDLVPVVAARAARAFDTILAQLPVGPASGGPSQHIGRGSVSSNMGICMAKPEPSSSEGTSQRVSYPVRSVARVNLLV